MTSSSDTPEPKLWRRGRVVLTWEHDPELAGLRIVMRRRPLGETLERWEAEDTAASLPAWEEMSGRQRADKLRGFADDLASLIVEWNLEDDRGDVAEISGASLVALLDNETIIAIRETYEQATTKVAPPLPQPSGDGSRSEEAALTLPTEPLSPSPQQQTEPASS